MQTYQDGLAALGDPTRRAIFELLVEGPTPVGQLAGLLPVSRPAVSQHLRVLKQAGLVLDRAVGTRRLYQIDPDGVAAIRAYLDRFWDRSLADFKAFAEQQFANEQDVSRLADSGAAATPPERRPER